MIILNTLPLFLSVPTYLTYIFLLGFVFLLLKAVINL